MKYTKNTGIRLCCAKWKIVFSINFCLILVFLVLMLKKKPIRRFFLYEENCLFLNLDQMKDQSSTLFSSMYKLFDMYKNISESV